MATGYKHIIWDWNGTLLDDTMLCLGVINRLLGNRGMKPITLHDYQENFGFPVVDFYNYLGFDADSDSFSAISREFITAYEHDWLTTCHLHQGAQQTLTGFKETGLTHSILSAAQQDALQIGVTHYSIIDLFTGLAGADNIYAHGKIERGEEWIAQLPYSREDVILIGDTLHDLEVAQKLAIDCILLSHGHHSHERLAKSGATVVAQLEDLLPLVEFNARP